MTLANPVDPSGRPATRPAQRGERGYALIALVGIMMVALIMTTVAAPQIKKDLQREREEEMLWRGEQVRVAIRRYIGAKGQFPTDLNDLVNGIKVGPAAKEIRFLRASALCDPLRPCESGSTNWHLVYSGDPEPAELRDALRAYLQKVQPGVPPTIPSLLEIEANKGMNQLPGQAADTKLDGNIGPVQSGESDADSGDALKKRPIVGVTSTSNEKMFRTYYGIEEYRSTLFFPEVPVPLGGSLTPMIPAAFGAGGFTPAVVNDRCPDGGVKIGGQCYGGLRPGVCSPPRRVNPQTGQCE